MARIPANQKMWNMFVAQAKARFDKWPSPTASAWVSQHYTQAGGKFVSSVEELAPKERRERAKEERKEEALKKRGLS